MALTTDQLRALLDPDEPNYATMATLLAPDDIPGLAALVNGGDAMLASKAAYAMTLIPDAAVLETVKSAATNANAAVRVAFASGLRNLGGYDVDGVMLQLLDDQDPGVRKTATSTAGLLESPGLKSKLRSVAEQDPEPGIRAIAKRALGEPRIG